MKNSRFPYACHFDGRKSPCKPVTAQRLRIARSTEAVLHLYTAAIGTTQVLQCMRLVVTCSDAMICVTWHCKGLQREDAANQPNKPSTPWPGSISQLVTSNDTTRPLRTQLGIRSQFIRFTKSDHVIPRGLSENCPHKSIIIMCPIKIASIHQFWTNLGGTI